MQTDRNSCKFKSLLSRGGESAKQFARSIRLSCSCHQEDRHAEDAFLTDLLDELMTNPTIRRRVDYVLSISESDPRFTKGLLGDERSLPGHADFLESGWTKIMLTRYALGMHYSEGRLVLDSCSGLGWGTYLIDSMAKHVIAVDIAREALEVSRSLWPTEVTDYVQASVLRPCLKSNSVDVALAIESIEHFTLADIHPYLDELKRALKPGGMLVGSSAFPETRKEADALCAKNPYHFHICTRSELVDMLRRRFRRYHVFLNGLFFWAEK